MRAIETNHSLAPTAAPPARPSRVTTLASIIVMAMAALVLLGWAFDWSWATRIHPSLPSMKVNTALCLLFAGFGLWRHPRGRKDRAGTVAACVVIALSAATLAQYLFGIDLGIDQLFLDDPMEPTHPGRMASATSVAILAAGGALLLLHARSVWRAQTIGLAIGVFALVSLVGHLYGAEALYRTPPFSSVALHTGIMLFTLALGMLYTRPDEGLMRVLTWADSKVAVETRRLIPVVLVLPILFGWLRLQGQRLGLYGVESGVAIFALSNVLVLVALLWLTAARQLEVELASKTALRATRKVEQTQLADQAFTAKMLDQLRTASTEAEVFEQAAVGLGAHLEASRAHLGEVDLQAMRVTLHRGYAREGAPLEATLPMNGFSPRTVEEHTSGRVVVNHDARTDERTAARFAAAYEPMGFAAYITAPIVKDDVPEAIMVVSESKPRRWAPREVALVTAIGERAWARVEELRLIDQREKLLVELRDLSTSLEERVKERTASLDAALGEGEVLLQEVHHRVKNNLQVIISMINIQSRGLGTEDARAHAILRDCQQRIQSIALIHEKLYQSSSYVNVPFSEYVRGLTSELVSAMGVATVRLEFDLETVTLPVDRAIPTGLILNELVTNALKHAFVDGRRGVLKVGLKNLDGRAKLIVADDGGGMKAITKPGASVGMRLIASLVRQLGGALETRDADGGLRVELDFELAHPKAGVT